MRVKILLLTLALASPALAVRRPLPTTRLDLDLKDADVHNVLRLLADAGQVNVVASGEAKGSVTMRLRDVSWVAALDAVLAVLHLGRTWDGDILRVAPLAEMEREAEARARIAKLEFERRPLVTRIVTLGYARAESVAPLVKAQLSERGTVAVDERTNSLIIRDVAAR